MPIKIHLSRILGERRITQAELHRLTGISAHTISAIYNERVSMISFRTLERLCEALDCSVGDILEYVPKAPSGEEKP